MSDFLKTPWRWLFPHLQRLLPAHHGQPMLAAIDRAATVFHALYQNGNYDPRSNGEGWLLERLRSTFPRVILDVGANRGHYSRLALATCDQARIYAFEPIPEVFAQLHANLGNHPRVELFALALADQNGPLEFEFNPANTGSTSAIRGVQSAVHGVAAPEKLTAMGRCLDDFCGEHGIHAIDLLKIDVEGFEASVLKGASRLIADSRISCIQLEYGRANLFSRTFIYDYMRDFGGQFAIGKLYPNGVHWFSQYDSTLDDLMGPNLVMASRQHPQVIETLSHRARVTTR